MVQMQCYELLSILIIWGNTHYGIKLQHGNNGYIHKTYQNNPKILLKTCSYYKQVSPASSETSVFINLSRPGQNGRHFTDDIFRCIFENGKFCILIIKSSLKFVPKVQLTINQ